MDLSPLDAIRDRLFRERQRLNAATTERERVFREVQVSQAEKELAAEMKFLGIDDAIDPAIAGMSDDELAAELGI